MFKWSEIIKASTLVTKIFKVNNLLFLSGDIVKIKVKIVEQEMFLAESSTSLNLFQLTQKFIGVFTF